MFKYYFLYFVFAGATIQPHNIYLDSWHQSEISNEDDAQFSGHVLHDRPALITKAWRKKDQHLRNKQEILEITLYCKTL